MPNPNYKAGRRFEYETMEAYRTRGFDVVRTAGSHGAYDVIAFDTKRKPIFIQCKRVTTDTQARGLIKAFGRDTAPSPYFHQCLAIKIKGTRSPMEVTF